MRELEEALLQLQVAEYLLLQSITDQDEVMVIENRREEIRRCEETVERLQDQATSSKIE